MVFEFGVGFVLGSEGPASAWDLSFFLREKRPRRPFLTWARASGANENTVSTSSDRQLHFIARGRSS